MSTLAPPRRIALAPGVIRADWWHRLSDGRLQCDLCPRECRLAEGQSGFCFVREARDGGIALISYGRASGFGLDPIEKKPLNHFLPGTRILSFGTAGCNLGCRFCQNWSISKARSDERLHRTASPDLVVTTALARGAPSIAFTYNDPVIFAEYAIDCAIAARERGVRTVAVTAGYMNPSPRAEFYRHMDAANVDLKAFSDEFYRRQCLGHLAPVLETLEYLRRETEVWLEVTTLLIPGLNDSESEIERLCTWYLDRLGPDVPLHFTAFHPDFKLLDRPATAAALLRRARRQALKAGLHHVYTGNVHDPEGQTTRCSACQSVLVARDRYEITAWALTRDARCPACGHALPGRFPTPAPSLGA